MSGKWKTRRAAQRGGGGRRPTVAYGALNPLVAFLPGSDTNTRSLGKANLRHIVSALKTGKTLPVRVSAIHRDSRRANVVFKGKKLSVPLQSLTIKRLPAPPTCTHCGLKPYTIPERVYAGIHHHEMGIEERNETAEVDMRKFRIVPKSANVWTAGLASCTGLYFEFGEYKFLAHIADPSEEEIAAAGSRDVFVNAIVDNMSTAVAKVIKEKGIKRLENVTLYTGAGGSSNNKSIFFEPSLASRTIALAVLTAIRGKVDEAGFRVGKMSVEDTCFMEMVPRRAATSMNDVD